MIVSNDNIVTKDIDLKKDRDFKEGIEKVDKLLAEGEKKTEEERKETIASTKKEIKREKKATKTV